MSLLPSGSISQSGSGRQSGSRSSSTRKGKSINASSTEGASKSVLPPRDPNLKKMTLKEKQAKLQGYLKQQTVRRQQRLAALAPAAPVAPPPKPRQLSRMEKAVQSKDYGLVHKSLWKGSEQMPTADEEDCHQYLAGVVMAALGTNHTMVLDEEGFMYSWGDSDCGALGLGDREDTDFSKPSPSPIFTNGFETRTVKQIAAGDDHSLALTTNGVLYAWGLGSFGRLGSGVDRNEYVPRRVVMDDIFVSCSAGSNFSACVCEHGQLFTCGAGYGGRLGHGDEEHQRNMKKVELPDGAFHQHGEIGWSGLEVTRVDCGANHMGIVMETGNIYVWGRNEHGQLGLPHLSGGSLVPVTLEPTFKSGSSEIVEISCGRFQTGVISSVGEVSVWGCQVVDGWYREAYQLRPFQPPILDGLRAVTVSFSDAASVVLTDTGDVVAWQTHEVPFRGKKSKDTKPPVIIESWKGRNVVEVYAGEVDGDYADEARLLCICNKNVWAKRILTGGLHTLSGEGQTVAHRACMVDSPSVLTLLGEQPDKSVLVKGNNQGQTPMHMCVANNANEALYGLLVAGVDYTTPDGEMWLPIEDAFREGLDSAVEVFTRHLEERSSKLIGAAMRDDVEQVTEALRAGDDPDTMPGKEKRTALMWACSLGCAKAVEVLALYSRVDQQEPEVGRTALHFAIRGLAAGPPRNNETQHVECVRHLLRFEADPKIADNDGRTPLDYAGTPKLHKYLEQVVAATKRGQDNASVYTVGVGAFSRLGHAEGDKNESFPRQLTSLMGVRETSCGKDHTACVMWNGDVYTWGDNLHGRTGLAVKKTNGVHPGPNQVLFPEKVPMYQHDDPMNLNPGQYKCKSVTCGLYHTMAICWDGSLLVWGSGAHGCLGRGDTETIILPTHCPHFNENPLRMIRAGDRWSAAVDLNGDLWTWGYGLNGRLGHGTEEDEIIPRSVENVKGNVRHISCGAQHGGVALKSGGIMMWGWSRYGQTGLGFDNELCALPTRLTFFDGMHMDVVECGMFHSVALTWKGYMYSWGRADVNGHGQEDNALTPKPLESLECLNIVKVSVGDECSAVTTDSEEMYTWGSPDHMSVLHPDGDQVLTPQLVTGFGVHHPYIPVCGEHHISILCSEGLTGAVMLKIGDQARSYLGRAMVHRIGIGGRKSMLELAVNNDFDLNVVDDFGNTALHYAVLGWRMELIRFLCECDSTHLFIENLDGDTAFDLCRKLQVGNVDSPMMKILVNAAERLQQTSSVNIAAMRGSDDLEKLLTSDKCPDLNQWGEFDERYPLMWACAFRRLKSVQLLLDYGALVNAIEGDQGRNCLHFACDYADADPEVVDLLLANGADLGQKDWKGRRPVEMESLCDEVRQQLKNKATLYAALRYRMDTIVIPVESGYDVVQSKMRKGLGCIPTLWVDLPATPELQIKNENFPEIIEKKRQETKIAELVLYIDSARLSRERRYLANSTNDEERNSMRNSKGFQRLCRLCHDDNLNTKREARRNLATLVGDAEANRIANIAAPKWTEKSEDILRPPPGKAYMLEKLLEASELKTVESREKEQAWHDHMAARMKHKQDLQNLMFDFQQQFDKLETNLAKQLEKNEKAKRRLAIKKKELSQSENQLKDKKEKLQLLHQETADDPELTRKSVGSFDAGSFDEGQREGSVAQRASFRASVQGLRARMSSDGSVGRDGSMRDGSLRGSTG